MPVSLFARSGQWVVLLLASVAAPCRGAEISDLYRYVASDAGLCVEFVELEAAWPRIRDSQWFARVQSSVSAREWARSDHVRKLQQVVGAIETAAQRPLPDLLGAVFGQRVVLAVYPGEDEPVAVLICRAKNKESLEAALKLWDRFDPATRTTKPLGAHVLVTRRSGNGSPVTYATVGGLLVLSQQPAEVERALNVAGQSEGGLPSDPLFVDSYRQLREESSVRLYVRLRAWDRNLAIEQTPSDRGEKMLKDVWQSCRTAVLGLEADNGLTLEAAVTYDPQASPAWQAFVSQMQGPATIFQQIPADALAAFGGRFRWTWVDAAVRELSPADDKPEWNQVLRVSQGLFLGQDPVRSVLPGLGQELCGYVVSSPSAAPEWAPLDFLLASRLVSSPETPQGPSLVQGLHNALRTGLNVWAAARNAEGSEFHAVIRVRQAGELAVTWLHGLPAWQPAFAVTAADLVLASSPEATEAFLRQEALTSLASDPAFRDWIARHAPEAGQVLFVNVSRIREWLKNHGSKLVQHLRPDVDPEVARRRLSRLDELLQPIDRLNIAARIESDRVRVVFSLTVDSHTDSVRGRD